MSRFFLNKASEKRICRERLTFHSTPHFDERVQSVVPDKNAPVIVYCASNECQLSPQAAKHLDRLGYTQVFDYEAGKADWEKADLPVETD